jgi:hypothetical protein
MEILRPAGALVQPEARGNQIQPRREPVRYLYEEKLARALNVDIRRVMKLDPTRMAQDIALSATSIGGLMTATNTSVAREYHAGLAAMLGIQEGRLSSES